MCKEFSASNQGGSQHPHITGNFPLLWQETACVPMCGILPPRPRHHGHLGFYGFTAFFGPHFQVFQTASPNHTIWFLPNLGTLKRKSDRFGLRCVNSFLLEQDKQRSALQLLCYGLECGQSAVADWKVCM